MSTIHHPTGITVNIVDIEANTNGWSCLQHDVCGALVEEDVVLRLQKVQILNSLGREETAIAAYQVSDGINQCCVGFLQRQFVTNAKTFDGILAQVTAVYSVGSNSPIKRKKCQHNMGCYLAALITDCGKIYDQQGHQYFLCQNCKRRGWWCKRNGAPCPFRKRRRRFCVLRRSRCVRWHVDDRHRKYAGLHKA